MAKYVVIDATPTDTFTIECKTKTEALTAAQNQWAALTEYDRRRRSEFAIIKSDNPDETALNHLDGAIVKIWK